MHGPSSQSPTIALLFGLPRLATAFCHTALFILALPLVVQEIWGAADKGFYLGMLSGGAAGLSILLVLWAGAHADRGQGEASRLSRRRAQVGWGLLAMGGAGAAAALGPTPLLAALALAAIMPARTMADTASLSLLAEHPGLRPVERFSSSVSLYHFLGSALGAAAFGAAPLLLAPGGEGSRILAAAAAPLLAVVCWLGFRGAATPPAGPETGRGNALPRWGLTRPMALFMASRVCFLAGMFIVPTFLLYMVQDLMHAPQARVTAAWLVGLTLAGAAAFAWPAARIARRIGEVPVLLAAGTALALAVTVFVPGAGWSPAVAPVCMAVYGAASGMVMTAGISLNMKLMPPEGAAGRIMALVAAGTFASQLAASMAGGLTLHHLNRLSPGLGYYGLLALVLSFLAAGAVLLILSDRCRPAGSGGYPGSGRRAHEG